MLASHCVVLAGAAAMALDDAAPGSSDASDSEGAPAPTGSGGSQDHLRDGQEIFK
jgi:hypothetical protein